MTSARFLCKVHGWVEMKDSRDMLGLCFGIAPEDLETLKRDGLVFEPHPGKYQIVR